jgi:glutamyl-tRNA reductase
VCIIGAGKMSKLLVKHMHSKGCTRMTILNRSLPRAEALAEEFPDVTFDIHLMGDLMKVRGGAGGVGGCGWTGWCSLWVGG